MLLAFGEVILILGNPAGIGVAFCAIAAWCFLEERFVPAGILLFAISLALKPHDSALVWLYFLLAGGVYRRRAIQTLLVLIAVSLPAILCVWRVSTHWINELQSNIAFFSTPGGITDPAPAPIGAHGGGVFINLQKVFSFFRNDPHIYNPGTYLVCTLLLLVWAFATLRCRRSIRSAWLAIAAISPLSMLPVYHHLLDAKLLLLTVPACAMLWAEGGILGWLAVLGTSITFVLTSELPWAVFLALTHSLHPAATSFGGQLFLAVQVLPAPLSLLFLTIFYLWVHSRTAHYSNLDETEAKQETQIGPCTA
jgi:hypothetical protein